MSALINIAVTVLLSTIPSPDAEIRGFDHKIPDSECSVAAAAWDAFEIDEKALARTARTA